MTDRPDRIPPKGRRATIIRATADSALPLSDIVRRVRKIGDLAQRDPSIDRLKTNAAVRDLRAAGCLSRTPSGYRATSAGIALLRASEGPA